MEITNHIKYDIAKRGIPPVVDAVQGEKNSRSIELSVFANGSAFPVDGCVCSLAFKKPDGTSGWYDTMPDGTVAFSINGNVISIKIASQVLTVAGEVNSAIRIESTDGSDRTTTFPIIINVSADPAIDAIKSDNYYSVQNWGDVNSAIDELREAIGSGGGGGGVAPLIVIYDDESDKANYSSMEIYEASLQRPVVLVHASKREHYQLDYCTEFAASFTRTDDTRILEQWVVDESKFVDYYYHGAIATQAQLEKKAEIDDTTVGSDAWSSKKTVDTLCPDFTESGAAVRREIVEGYPLTVVASEEATKITRCGKNLIDKANIVYDRDLLNSTGKTKDCPGWYATGWIPVSPSTTYTISGTSSFFRAEVDENFKPVREGNFAVEQTYKTTEKTHYVRHNSITDGYSNPQLELGNTATAYEPYRCDTFAPGEKIPALKGVNVLYADHGEITVSGKASPTEIFGTVEDITKTYELIEDFTLAEDATSIRRSTDPNGNPYNFSAVRIFVETAPIEDVTNGQVTFSLKDARDKVLIYHQTNSGITSTARRTSLVARNDNGLIEYYVLNSSGESSGTLSSKPAYNAINVWQNVCSIGLSTYSAPHYPAGTRIVIYAIRG